MCRLPGTASGVPVLGETPSEPRGERNPPGADATPSAAERATSERSVLAGRLKNRMASIHCVMPCGDLPCVVLIARHSLLILSRAKVLIAYVGAHDGHVSLMHIPHSPAHADRYRYTEELLALQQCVATPPKTVPPALKGSASPLDWREWERALAAHPDRQFAEYVSGGIRDGFRVGFDYSSRCRHGTTLRSSGSIWRTSARKGESWAPSSQTRFHTSRFGVIPKKGRNKWRLILDLSSPDGCSVIDGIQPDLCSLSYVSVDDAARAVAQKGRGFLMAKVDVKSAYRVVPVHPEDRLLLGMSWEGDLFVDTVLPFGLRSAPKIFTALADALEWVIRQTGRFLPPGRTGLGSVHDMARLAARGLCQTSRASGAGEARGSGHLPYLSRYRAGLGADVPAPPPREAPRATRHPGRVGREEVVPYRGTSFPSREAAACQQGGTPGQNLPQAHV